MKRMTQGLLFIFGAIVGSFLNVVGLRWDKGNFGGRSACPRCNTTLHWYELIPILSFVLQRGKCRSCNAKISWQYPIIEILTGLVFLLAYDLRLAAPNTLIFLVVSCLYIVILIYDIRHKIIPDALVYPAILLSFVGRWLSGGSTLDWLAGPLIFAFFGSIWLFSRGRAMGFGDAKLGLSVGLLLGATHGFSAIVLAFWLGATASLLYILLNKIGFLKDSKHLTMKSEVPFAPFIILGAWLALAFRFDILHVALS